MDPIQFETHLHGDGDGYHSIRVPSAIGDPIAEAHSRRVIIRINDRHEWNAALMPIKGEGYYIMVSKKNYRAAEAEPGGEIQVELRPDLSKYGMPVPEEFEAVMETDPEGEAAFEELKDGTKRSLLYLVSKYKDSDRRIEKSLDIMEKLKLGITDRRQLGKWGF